jgi:hypothetical protein
VTTDMFTSHDRAVHIRRGLPLIRRRSATMDLTRGYLVRADAPRSPELLGPAKRSWQAAMAGCLAPVARPAMRPASPDNQPRLLVALLVAFARHHRRGPRRNAAGRQPALHRLLRGRLVRPGAMPTRAGSTTWRPRSTPATWRLVVAHADSEGQLSVSTAAKTPGETVDGYGRGSEIGCRAEVGAARQVAGSDDTPIYPSGGLVV